MSHSAISQGIIITHDDSLIQKADSGLHIAMHFLPRCNGQVDTSTDLDFQETLQVGNRWAIGMDAALIFWVFPVFPFSQSKMMAAFCKEAS